MLAITMWPENFPKVESELILFQEGKASEERMIKQMNEENGPMQW